MARMQFAHSDQTEIREVGLAIRIPRRESGELRQMIIAIELERDEAFLDHREHERDTLKMESRLGEHGLAREQRLGQALSDLDRPVVVSVVSIRERDEKSGVGDALHERENPFRAERSFGPRTEPARRMKACLAFSALALSS